MHECNTALLQLYKNPFSSILWTTELTASTGSNETCYKKTGISGKLQSRRRKTLTCQSRDQKRSANQLNCAAYFHLSANELYLWILF